ncbi:centrosomal protein kizuna isoform X2 [Dunckerocampus dactyliophorus]|uniref:centrosomal protein kizuna isoform X2 n=1 Tax=Dunckerocampus dactyliophorus TaxID=161453 RepID=UPI00240739A6|nr:centrosomal protein kizuna isoform X2 [Dunckerocampus dactyliophorus]
MSSVTHVEDSYLQRITSIQQSMHQSSQIKSYLKQICVREAQAKMRNLELLRDVECLHISMQEYSPNLFPLQQQKAEFSRKIARFMDEMKTTSKAKLKPIQGDCKNRSLLHIAEDFSNAPAVFSMGHQTSRGSSILSHQALHRSRSPNRSKRQPSGLLKDFRVVRVDAAANRAHLSDGISASDNSPNGCNFSDKHSRMSVVLQSGCGTTIVPGNAHIANEDEQEQAPVVTLESPRRNTSRGTTNNSMKLKNPAAEHANSGEIAPQMPFMEDSGRGFSHLMPEASSGRKTEDVSGRSGSFSSKSDVQLSESSVSDLSISLTQSEPEDDDNESEGTAQNTNSEGSWCGPVTILKSNGSKNTPHYRREILSREGLFKLLDSIEGRLYGEQTRVYRDVSFDERQLMRIISLCDSGAGLNEEDLEACGAVVLHELQRLSWSTTKGCLLPQELVSAHQSTTEHIAISLPADAAQLWDRWFKHALLLKESRVLSAERLVELFTPLLVERHATYSHQAKVLLRTLLTRSSEESPSADDENDSSFSCGPHSHSGDVKPASKIQKEQIKELQSAEEDSQDESPVESVPIRETKAYQLLKLSAMQERLQSSEEEEEEEDEDREEDGPSGINHGHEVDLGRAKCSSDQDPYPRKDKVNPKIYSALQSNAFWGDSDDSNSEIEAALRPQPFNTNDDDDTDDFYD